MAAMQKHLTSFPADLLQQPASEEADCAGCLTSSSLRCFTRSSDEEASSTHPSIHPSSCCSRAISSEGLSACLESGSGLVDKAMENEKICEDEAALYSSRALVALRRSPSVTSLVS
mmetsp:Transcript_953/g.2248  ORF Transcript_953/g.2248 Transcript_953/m.2248 type:complete len:116 (-) Transcript_953:908-1255(-)